MFLNDKNVSQTRVTNKIKFFFISEKFVSILIDKKFYYKNFTSVSYIYVDINT